MGFTENQPAATRPQLSSSRLRCLQHMGITVWQRRDLPATSLATEIVSESAAEPASESVANSHPVPQTLADSQPQTSQVPAQRNKHLLQMQVNKALADTAVVQANVVIVRVALSAAAAKPLDTDEYQLLLKMMMSINLAANQWICASEADPVDAAVEVSQSGGNSPAGLVQLLDAAKADVLLLLLPANELVGWEQYWVDFDSAAASAALPLKKINFAGRPIAVAPLCDPYDLLLDGALKRDAWECLKRVRAALSGLAGSGAGD